MPICTQGMQRTWWPGAGTIIVTGPYLTISGSDNGLSTGRRQAIIWTNAGILLILTLGTNFSEILSEIHTLSIKKMHLKMSSGRWRPSCLSLSVLNEAIDMFSDSLWKMFSLFLPHALNVLINSFLLGISWDISAFPIPTCWAAGFRQKDLIFTMW